MNGTKPTRSPNRHTPAGDAGGRPQDAPRLPVGRHNLSGVAPIPAEHLRLVADNKPDLYRRIAAEHQLEAELGDAPTRGQIAIVTAAVVALTFFVWALDAGWFR